MAERWFTGKFLSLAIALNNVVSLSGSALFAWLGPQLFISKRDILFVVFVMSAVCFASWLFSVGYFIAEEKLIKQEKDQDDEIERNLFKKRQATIMNMKASGVTEEEPSQRGNNNEKQAEVKFSFKHIKYLGKLFWLLALVFMFVS